MAHAGQETPATAHEAHAAHEAEDPDFEPDAALGPKTPGWLTALGGALFLAAGAYWLASRPSDPTLEELTARAAPSASEAPSAAAPPPPAPAPTPVPAAVASAMPAASAKVLAHAAPRPGPAGSAAAGHAPVRK